MGLDKIAFPPVIGTTCLTYYDDGDECWHRCEVLGTTNSEMCNGYVAVVLRGKHDGKLIWASEFRKIKTERDIVIETVMKVVGDYHKLEDVLGNLYDLGVLKLPTPTPPPPWLQPQKVAKTAPNYDVAYQIQP